MCSVWWCSALLTQCASENDASAISNQGLLKTPAEKGLHRDSSVWALVNNPDYLLQRFKQMIPQRLTLPLSTSQQQGRRQEDVAWHIIYIFHCSPKGEKPKAHQNSASMHGMNHCSLQHVRAVASSPHCNHKRQHNLSIWLLLLTCKTPLKTYE